MEKAIKHIIITGPESSGKTTLSQGIAARLNTTYTTEYARKFLETLNREYTQEDLISIAKGQLQNERKNRNSIAIHDTDLITVKIWSEFKYNSCHPWIIEKIEQFQYNKKHEFLQR